MRREIFLCLSSLALFVVSPVTVSYSQPGASAATPAEIKNEAQRQQKAAAPSMLNQRFTSMNVCAGGPVPGGWIVTNDMWNPTTCGNPTMLTYNVWIITQYSSLPIGATLSVCSYSPTPAGWVVIGSNWNPTSCGHPSSITNNVTVIRRVQ